MPRKGRAHFDTYTDQNRVKHAILTKYLDAYLKALRTSVDAFHYIDGFAGPGTYDAEQIGSPLFALDLLANQPKPATASFVENDATLFASLERIVGSARSASRLVEAPWLRRAEFSACLDEIIARPALAKFRRVATFAFVDPCGLTGMYVDDLAKILRLPFGECLIFFNYDGLNRWIGGVEGGSHPRQKLERFFGSADAATEALTVVHSGASGPPRERRLLEMYFRAVRGHARAEFVLPFRFRSGDRERTSHYLVHLARHPLAFTIMKDVMRSESSAAEDFGMFGFIPPDELTDQEELFRPNAERARAEILEALQRGPQPVATFAKEWPQRPHDMLVSKEYKRIILDLEREEAIEVVDRQTFSPAPVAKRRKRLGQPTLGEDYLVRLPRRHEP